MDWTLYKMIRDAENNIIPQMFIPGTGFRPLTGEAVDVGRYGYDNIMWGKTSGGVYVPVQVDAEGKQAVKASELETKIDTLNAKVDGIISGDAPAKTELMGSKVGVEKEDYSQEVDVPAGGATSIAVVPPEGELWRLKFLAVIINAVIDATTGDHYFQLRSGQNSYSWGSLISIMPYNKMIRFGYNEFTDMSVAIDVKPSTPEAQQLAVLNTMVTNSTPLYFYYNNRTDAPYIDSFTITMTREVERIVT